MRAAIAVAVMLAVALAGGCGMTSNSPQGGGMGKDEGFKIGTPMTGVKLKQNETRTIKVELKRGKFFHQDVTVQARASEGITVEPAEVTLRASDPAQMILLVSAGKDTAIGEHRVYLKGVPQTGEPAMAGVKVTVEAP